MFNNGILNTILRLTRNNVLIPSRNIFLNAPLYFNVTKSLFAEPLKKKKKIDPAVLKMREERRLRRLGKQVRRLEKRAAIPLPIFENEPPLQLIRQRNLRLREKPNLTPEKIHERKMLFKEWTRYKTNQHKENLKVIQSFMNAQMKALEELRAVSEELYLDVIQLDDSLLPYTANGPVHSAPIPGFDPPDGEYVDISRKYK